MTRHPVLAMILALCYLAESAAEAVKLYPVDEGPKDRSFVVFRSKLKKAARKRDRLFLISILDPAILSGYGERKGIREFKLDWELDQPDSPLWGILLQVLSMGGVFDKQGRFFAPYVSYRWPDGVDGQNRNAVIARNVRVRQRPSLIAPVVETLSYDIVRVHRDADKDENGMTWIKITTPSGKQGYVDHRYLWNPVHVQAYFQKRGGKWRMTGLTHDD
jgi:hypothetical protein